MRRSEGDKVVLGNRNYDLELPPFDKVDRLAHEFRKSMMMSKPKGAMSAEARRLLREYHRTVKEAAIKPKDRTKFFDRLRTSHEGASASFVIAPPVRDSSLCHEYLYRPKYTYDAPSGGWDNSFQLSDFHISPGGLSPSLVGAGVLLTGGGIGAETSLREIDNIRYATGVASIGVVFVPTLDEARINVHVVTVCTATAAATQRTYVDDDMPWPWPLAANESKVKIVVVTTDLNGGSPVQLPDTQFSFRSLVSVRLPPNLYLDRRDLNNEVVELWHSSLFQRGFGGRRPQKYAIWVECENRAECPSPGDVRAASTSGACNIYVDRIEISECRLPA